MNLTHSNILQSFVCSLLLTFATLLLPPYTSYASPITDINNNNIIDNHHNAHLSECHPLEMSNTVCSKWYKSAQVPNIFGHDTLLKARAEMNDVFGKLPDYPSEEVLSFMCVIYLPPCSGKHVQGFSAHQRVHPLPCRTMCDAATLKLSRDIMRSTNTNGTGDGNGQRNFRPWPVMCHTLPTQRCYVFERNTGISFVQQAVSDAVKGLPKVNEIAKVASIEAELGDVNNEGYDLEVVSLTTNEDQGRRYDITDLGDPDLFQGWADVQGTGSSNDYCRVVGRSKRRFLSCHLSGNANQGHHYVSKLGFEIGYPGTWFMRDMDGDGRDDYCRCVGSPSSSKVTCMKAGPRGFHGSPMQAGSQHSFALTSSTGCHNRRVNAMFGE